MSEGCFPKWEEWGYTPLFFVRVANKGVKSYVKQKSAQAIENKGQILVDMEVGPIEGVEGGRGV